MWVWMGGCARGWVGECEFCVCLSVCSMLVFGVWAPVCIKRQERKEMSRVYVRCGCGCVG